MKHDQSEIIRYNRKEIFFLELVKRTYKNLQSIFVCSLNKKQTFFLQYYYSNDVIFVHGEKKKTSDAYEASNEAKYMTASLEE